ncbi:LacI family DNA-binding transcriptional regulator [Compostimonas suwonensis]|uniref:DNA-binding LacI/PurR family transcriptional regulator n=1 Tax=Compostimonas suwonensis TaxID=1048394 RepID=A0A2M9BCP6_9MICO|nr:LacI family DNA-binding transcriptional regulator [Compostimonas suwonensis]PJJ55721.1 DNA-binding LacI/PurR family transcriptional regulator [Compostimonas suwonensis]
MNVHTDEPTEPAKGRAPSIRDVARLAEVSHQTVSRVLNDHTSIRDTTRQRVLEAMEQLQYRPNLAARRLVTSRSRTIGVLRASSQQYGPASSIAAIEEAAREAGYFVNTANLDLDDPESMRSALNHLMSQAVEGLVVIAPQVRIATTLAEMSISIPFVTMQSAGAGHALSVDQVAGARMATRHLVGLGHRDILHLAGPTDWVEAQARVLGFEQELAASGLPVAAPVVGDWTAAAGYEAGRRMLAAGGFTAVFSSNDQMALGVLHAVRDAGLDVPREVSVVGFDDIPEAAHFWPPLTTVRQDFAELGRRCIARLLGEIEGTPPDDPGDVVPELVVRASTAPPRL